MDHKSLLASLSGEERNSLTVLSDWPGLFKLVQHVVFMAVLVWAILAGVPGWPVLMLPLGIQYVFLFTLLHETVHRTPFRNVWLNRLAGRICSVVLILPADWFRYFHLAHHRFTQEPGKDPELAEPKPETVRQYIVHISGLAVWRGHLTTLFRNAVQANRDSFVPARGKAKVMREAQAMVVLYAILLAGSLWTGSTMAFWTWILPLLVGQPFLRLYLLAEHGRCAFVANMFENTRTTFTNRLVRWLAWNMPYHAEHHAYPAVPYHKLPAFHARTREHLQVTEDGYARFSANYVKSLES
ncbi:fatty acid desaturase [Anderseniella sp. Alg231-50]|uniref:fatty acid desaturase n=1 Tax=Anderseniella sp. Alg231-50 TaxID=1922226 RepID=UPI000D54FDAE